MALMERVAEAQRHAKLELDTSMEKKRGAKRGKVESEGKSRFKKRKVEDTDNI